MSDTIPDSVSIRQMLTQIDRNIAEAGKLYAEQAKLLAEQRKLNAEATKLGRDRFLAPLLALVATLGAIAGLAPVVLRAWGFH